LTVVLGITISVHIGDTTATDAGGNLVGVVGAQINTVDDAVSGDAQVNIGNTTTTDTGYQLVGITVTIFLAVKLGVTISVPIGSVTTTDTRAQVFVSIVRASILTVKSLITISVDIINTAATDTSVSMLERVGRTGIVTVKDLITILIRISIQTTAHTGVLLVDIIVTFFFARHITVTIGVDILFFTATNTRGSLVTFRARVVAVGDTIGIVVILNVTTAAHTRGLLLGVIITVFFTMGVAV